MPRTVDEGFRAFLTRLTPTGGESEAARSHRSTIQRCLAGNYTLKRFLRIGSFGNGTSVTGWSDVDYLAEVSAANLSTDSDYCLRKLRNHLDYRFPHSSVRVRCPAVEVPFGTDARNHTEVVLAYDTGKQAAGHRVYGIANGSGGWMRTAPDAHKAYVLRQDIRLNAKVRPLIRFVKAWKFLRGVPISSFYLEMRVAQYAATRDRIIYSYDLSRFLKSLQDNRLAALQDPMGVSGYIYACDTQLKANDAMSKLNRAVTRAVNARTWEREGDIEEAFEWWRLLFDVEFPTYYR